MSDLGNLPRDFEEWFAKEHGGMTAHSFAKIFSIREPKKLLSLWELKQKEVDSLKAQLNNMETCYIEKKKQVEELQGRIDASKSPQPKLHKTDIGDCLHFSTTMFHDGKATCFDCDAVVNHKREVIGVMQTRSLRGEP